MCVYHITVHHINMETKGFQHIWQFKLTAFRPLQDLMHSSHRWGLRQSHFQGWRTSPSTSKPFPDKLNFAWLNMDTWYTAVGQNSLTPQETLFKTLSFGLQRHLLDFQTSNRRTNTGGLVLHIFLSEGAEVHSAVGGIAHVRDLRRATP